MEIKALFIRTCDKDLKGHGGFQWPESGLVTALDWKPTKECGFGLHGLKWGKGDWSLLSKQADAKWMVFEADENLAVDIDGQKHKVQTANVVYCGTSKGAITFLLNYLLKQKSTEITSTTDRYAHANTAGNSAHANTAGNSAHANTAGNSAHANTAGYSAHANTAGYSAHANTAGYYAHANTAGNSAHANTAGNSAHANTAGYYAHANTAGYYAHANTAGNSAHANTAGDSAHASTKGEDSVSCCLGYDGRAKASKGVLVMAWHDGKRRRISVGYVGEGIEADQWYRVGKKGQFIKCSV
jgi:hypothetical protein